MLAHLKRKMLQLLVHQFSILESIWLALSLFSFRFWKLGESNESTTPYVETLPVWTAIICVKVELLIGLPSLICLAFERLDRHHHHHLIFQCWQPHCHHHKHQQQHHCHLSWIYVLYYTSHPAPLSLAESHLFSCRVFRSEALFEKGRVFKVHGWKSNKYLWDCVLNQYHKEYMLLI